MCVFSTCSVCVAFVCLCVRLSASTCLVLAHVCVLCDLYVQCVWRVCTRSACKRMCTRMYTSMSAYTNGAYAITSACTLARTHTGALRACYHLHIRFHSLPNSPLLTSLFPPLLPSPLPPSPHLSLSPSPPRSAKQHEKVSRGYGRADASNHQLGLSAPASCAWYAELRAARSCGRRWD